MGMGMGIVESAGISDATSSNTLDGGWSSSQAFTTMGMYAPMSMAPGFLPGGADYYGQPTVAATSETVLEPGLGQQHYQRGGRPESQQELGDPEGTDVTAAPDGGNQQMAAAAMQQQAYMAMAGYPMYAGHNPMYGHQQPAGYPGYGYGYGFPPGGVPFKAAAGPYGGYIPGGAQQPGGFPRYAQHVGKGGDEHSKPRQGGRKRGGRGGGGGRGGYGGARDHQHRHQQQQQQQQQQAQGGFPASSAATAAAGQPQPPPQPPVGLEGYGLPGGGELAMGAPVSLYGGARDPQDGGFGGNAGYGGYGGYGQQPPQQGWHS